MKRYLHYTYIECSNSHFETLLKGNKTINAHIIRECDMHENRVCVIWDMHINVFIGVCRYLFTL